MTAFALVGSTGKSFTLGVGVYGMLASASGIMHSLCFFVIGLRLWGFHHRYGYTTQIQFFRHRLESDRIGLLLFPVLVALVIPYLLIGVVSSGIVVSNVTQGAFADLGLFAAWNYAVPPWLASLVICLVVLCYMFFGGMRGTAWANAFQTAVFMLLGVVAFFTIAKGLGGADSLWASMQAASRAVDEDHLTRARVPKAVYFSFKQVVMLARAFVVGIVAVTYLNSVTGWILRDVGTVEQIVRHVLADLLRGISPHDIGIAEDNIASCGHYHPATELQLAFQLVGCPAGIATVDSKVGLRLSDQLVQMVLVSSEMNSWNDLVFCVRLVCVDCHQRAFHRSARVDRGRTVALCLGQVFPDLADHTLRGAVQYDAEGALVVMVDDQHDRAVEIHIRQSRRCNQQVSLKRSHGGAPFLAPLRPRL